MLNANATCQVYKNRGHDRYGQPSLGAPVTERCAVVKLRREMQHTTVRADSSQSRGHGDEFVSTNKVLMSSTTAAQLGDKVVVAGVPLKVVSLNPQFDVSGKVDHYELTGELWG